MVFAMQPHDVHPIIKGPAQGSRSFSREYEYEKSIRQDTFQQISVEDIRGFQPSRGGKAYKFGRNFIPPDNKLSVFFSNTALQQH